MSTATALVPYEAPSQAIVYEPAGPKVGDQTVRHVESVLGSDGVMRPTGREILVTYRTVVTAAVLQGGRP